MVGELYDAQYFLHWKCMHLPHITGWFRFVGELMNQSRGDLSIMDFLDGINSLADQLAFRGSIITDDDLVAPIMKMWVFKLMKRLFPMLLLKRCCLVLNVNSWLYSSWWFWSHHHICDSWSPCLCKSFPRFFLFSLWRLFLWFPWRFFPWWFGGSFLGDSFSGLSSSFNPRPSLLGAAPNSLPSSTNDRFMGSRIQWDMLKVWTLGPRLF